MHLSEKLDRLTSDKVRAQVARDARIHSSVLNGYIKRQSEPMAGAAFRLASVLSVPLDWLLDDSRGWPPPPEDPVKAASTAKLALELGSRMKPLAEEIVCLARRAMDVDWVRVLDRFAKDGSVAAEELALVEKIEACFRELRQYSPVIPRPGEPDEEPGQWFDPDEPLKQGLDLVEIVGLWAALYRQQGYSTMPQLAKLLNQPAFARNPAEESRLRQMARILVTERRGRKSQEGDKK